MIQEIRGDLLTYGADIICHQANFYGVMGGGVALSIWNKLLNDDSRYVYQDLCCTQGRRLLGSVLALPFTYADGKPGEVFNLFCQDDRAQPDGGITRYDCMYSCLKRVEGHAKLHLGKRRLLSVALPGGMGCGIAGGDWPTVRGIIEEVFGDSPVSCTIVFLDRTKKVGEV